MSYICASPLTFVKFQSPSSILGCTPFMHTYPNRHVLAVFSFCHMTVNVWSYVIIYVWNVASKWDQLVSLSPDPKRLSVLLGRVYIWFCVSLYSLSRALRLAPASPHCNNLGKLTEMSKYVTVTQDKALQKQDEGGFKMKRKMPQCPCLSKFEFLKGKKREILE